VKTQRQATAPLEHFEQVTFFNEIKKLGQTDYRYELIFAIPNSGSRSYGALSYYRAEGLRKGIPDIFVAYPSGRFHGCFIEMKRVGGKYTDLSQSQVDWLAKLAFAGYKTMVGFGSLNALEQLKTYFGEL